MRMSTSGTFVRHSTRTQMTSSTAAATSRPIVRAEVQPQFEPSLTATSRAMSQPASRIAPGMSTRPAVLIGDSGTKKTVPSVATTTAISGNQKSQ